MHINSLAEPTTLGTSMGQDGTGQMRNSEKTDQWVLRLVA